MNRFQAWPKVSDPKPPRNHRVIIYALLLGVIAWAAIILAITTSAHAAPPGYKLTQVHESLTRPQLTIYVIQSKKAGNRMTVRDCYDRGYVINQDFVLKKGIHVYWAQPGFTQCLQFETWQKKRSKVTVTRWDG